MILNCLKKREADVFLDDFNHPVTFRLEKLVPLMSQIFDADHADFIIGNLSVTSAGRSALIRGNLYEIPPKNRG